MLNPANCKFRDRVDDEGGGGRSETTDRTRVMQRMGAGEAYLVAFTLCCIAIRV